MNGKVTLKDVAKSVNDLAAAVKTGFDGVDTRLNAIETHLNGVDTRLTSVEANMATKDFIERRLAKTDGKINSLIHTLEKKRVISEEEKRTVLL